MAENDELATLFARNLSLYPYAPPVEEAKQDPEPYIYSITQHYHHSAHLVAQQPSRPASEPPQTDQLTAEIILSRHGVDINTLSGAQLELFRSSAPEQQMHLIQLWLISPPQYGGHALVQDLPATSYQQEEAMAKMRMERRTKEEETSRTGGDMLGMTTDGAEDTMSDSSNNAPLTPIQGGDGRWTAANNWTSYSTNAEPYIQSGYEALAQREYEISAATPKDSYSHFGTAVGGPQYTPATDPVYKSIEDLHMYPNSGNNWQAQQQQQVMENQYGAFQQQFQHNAGVTVGYQGEDEEML